MDTSWLVAFAGTGLAAMLVMVAGAVLLATLVLCGAFRLVLGYVPSCPRALQVVLLTAATVTVVVVTLDIVMPGATSRWLAAAVACLVGVGLINALLLAQDGRQVGYGKAALVQLAYVAITVVLIVLVKAILAAASGDALLGGH